MDYFSLDWYALLRFCGSLGIFLLIYYCLFDQKAPYKHCRAYLLVCVILALVASVVRIPVYPALEEQKTEKLLFVEQQMEEPQVLIEEEYKQQDSVSLNLLGSNLAGEADEVVLEPMVQGEERFNVYWDWEVILLVVYLAVVFLLLLRWGYSAWRIGLLKRWGSRVEDGRLTVVRNNRVASPFSFFRTIYIDRKLTGKTLEIILLHEKCHIVHKHYRDACIIELYTILFWFNPFVWLIKRELRALHEFEVDQTLLSEEIGLSEYQNVIFSELFGNCPNIANGFHNSLIKKRFIMMKRGNVIRYTFLRKMVAMPLMILIAALFAFTMKDRAPVEILKLPLSDGLADTILETPEIVTPSEGNPSEPSSPNDEKENQEKVVENVTLPEPPAKETRPTSAAPTAVVKKDEPQWEIFVPVDESVVINEKPMRLNEKQLVVSSHSFQGWTSVRYIEPLKHETRVVVMTPMNSEMAWIKFNKGYSLVDERTGDIYKLRSVARGIPMNQVMIMEGKKGQMFEFTLIFPPLKSKVKQVDLCDKFPEESGPTPEGGMAWNWKGLRIDRYLPPADRDRYYNPDGSRKYEYKLQHQVLTEKQIVPVSMKWTGRTSILRIVNDETETRVTLAVPIIRDHNWTAFDPGFCMVDCRTGDEYKIRSLTKGMKLNTALWIDGHKGQMVEFTMVFPPLKSKVKYVDFYTKYPEEAALTPEPGEPWHWRSICVADYLFPKGEIIY